MLNSFTVVGTNILILFILIALGFCCAKINLLSEAGIKSMNNIMLNIVTPCVVINALQRDFEPELLKGLLLSMLAAVIAHAIPFIIAHLLIKNFDDATKAVLRFSSIFSNCGFMAIPLIEALCGKEGLFYGAGFMVVCNLFMWSWGQYQFASDTGEFEIKKIFINPGIISNLAGLLFFFCSIKIPPIILKPMEYIGGLNTPVPMMIIGYNLAQMGLKDCFKLKKEWITPLIRLVLSPTILLIVLYSLGFRGIILVTTMICGSAPAGATVAMFAIKFDKDPGLASKIVSVTTLLSSVTMTILVSIAMYIS